MAIIHKATRILILIHKKIKLTTMNRNYHKPSPIERQTTTNKNNKISIDLASCSPQTYNP